MNDNVGPWSRITRSNKIGHVQVQNQQEYEHQLINGINQLDNQD